MNLAWELSLLESKSLRKLAMGASRVNQFDFKYSINTDLYLGQMTINCHTNQNFRLVYTNSHFIKFLDE
jgi:hypothetical protein